MSRGLLLLGIALLAGCTRPDPHEERPGMAFIPGGEFRRGSGADDPGVYDWEKPREQPQHPVHVDAFYLDVHEVTNREFERFMPTHKRNLERSPCDDCPVVE